MSSLDYFSSLPGKIITVLTTAVSFVVTYFFELTIDNFEQYLAVCAVVLLDGFFGVCAGTKLEGFKTYKAIKVLKTLFGWIVILSVLLMVESGIAGTNWLSETIVIPFIVFQVISALKNASLAGFIDAKLLNDILYKIDQHKHIK